jgi:hypothetical protein
MIHIKLSRNSSILIIRIRIIKWMWTNVDNVLHLKSFDSLLIVISFFIDYYHHVSRNDTFWFDVFVHSIIVCIAIRSKYRSNVRSFLIEIILNSIRQFWLYVFSRNIIFSIEDNLLIKYVNCMLVELVSIRVVQMKFVSQAEFWIRDVVVSNIISRMMCVERIENEWWIEKKHIFVLKQEWKAYFCFKARMKSIYFVQNSVLNNSIDENEFISTRDAQRSHLWLRWRLS